MSRGMVSFLAGLGTGYIRAKDKEYDRKRQEEADARAKQLHDMQMGEYTQRQSERQAIADATADRSTIQGTAVTDAAGNSNLYTNPEQAAKAAEDERILAEMQGKNPAVVGSANATGIVGNMSQGNQITSAPVDLAALNSKDAKMGRAVDALMKTGNAERAMTMENSVMENKAKRLGLDAAQLRFADEQFNRELNKQLMATPDFWGNAAKVLTDTKLGGLDGYEVKPVVTSDGKVQLVGSKDGAQPKVFASFDNNERGRQRFMQDMAKVSPETRIMWLKESADREAAEAKDTRDFGLREKEVDSKAALRAAQAENQLLRTGIAMAGVRGREAQGGGLAVDDLDKVLLPLFKVDDPVTGAKSINSDGMTAVRGLAMYMPEAKQGDATGAALRAYSAYQAALKEAGGDQNRAMQLLNGAIAAQMNGGKAQPQQTQPAPGTAAKQPAPPTMTGAVQGGPQTGVFRDKDGNLQLLQPFYTLGDLRRSMQAETNATR